jgi:ribosomal protein S18 acetylase RimI-like enzyme
VRVWPCVTSDRTPKTDRTLDRPGNVVTLRRATVADAGAAERIIAAALAEYRLSFEPDGRDADVKSFGARPYHDDLVATDDAGAVVGIASVGPHGEDALAWVSKVFVSREARRRGIGRALLEALHVAARARGYVRVGLRTRVQFHEAIALYESLGYEVEGERGGDLVYFRTL